MKLDNPALIRQVTNALTLFKKYAVFSFIILFLCVYVFLVLQIGKLINSEVPAQATTETSTKPITKLQIDKSAAEQMEQLESQNIEVQTLFNQARQNPFTE